MTNFTNRVLDVLETEIDSAPAMWAPGVTQLGWSFSFGSGNDLIINKALAENYKMRLIKYLPKAFEKAGLQVNIRFDDKQFNA